MIEDENTATDGDEAPAEPQPTDENGDVIAPPSDEPEGEDLPVSEVEASVNPEGELAEGVEVDEDGEVIPIAPESVTEGEGGDTTVLSGGEPETLSSGDELPAHRRQVEGV